MTDAWIAALSALGTGLLSLIGVYFSNRASAKLIEYKIQELTEQVKKHNGFGDRITTVETQIKGMMKDIDDLKRKVSA